MASWKVFEGDGSPRNPAPELPPPPPWRTFSGTVLESEQIGGQAPVVDDPEAQRRLGPIAVPFDPEGEVVMMVNAAIHLRRALLVTGRPGVGKSSLAYVVARELRLGPVLRWPITTRSTLQSGLYNYDALARLQAAQSPEGNVATPPTAKKARPTVFDAFAEIGRFIQLGPLGTALVPRCRPRVLLIDEIDKSDIDLPDDLLTVLEDGAFEIPELTRYERSERVRVRTADHGRTSLVERGKVTCREFPLVIMTSNGERDFPPAFLRRCLRLEMESPPPDRLRRLIDAHLGNGSDAEAVEQLLERFTAETRTPPDEAAGQCAPDQLLNAVFIIARNALPDDEANTLADRLFRPLGS